MGNLSILAENIRFVPEIELTVDNLGGEDHFQYDSNTDTYLYKDDLSVVVGGAVACNLCADTEQAEEFKTYLEEASKETDFQGRRA